MKSKNKRSFWLKQHRWFGVVLAFFIIIECLSGIVLNHRSLFAQWQVSRAWLPGWYEYRNWNGGLLRGSVAHPDKQHIILYGNNGIWISDKNGQNIKDFNRGLPASADYRQVRAVKITPQQDIYALTTYHLYRFKDQAWQIVDLPRQSDHEWLTDLTTKGDTIVAMGRSHLYIGSVSAPFMRSQLQASPDDDGKTTWFRLVWLIHSGELFGLVGKLLVDTVGIVLIVLIITGLALWLLPYLIEYRRKQGKNTALWRTNQSKHLRIHDVLGRKTILITLFITFTGWCLRPPVLILLALNRITPPPFTTLQSDNPWNERLRMIRYNQQQQQWMISTSEGFYSFKDFSDKPMKMSHTPPVSVMGLNVWEQQSDSTWLCGSFSGMYRWDMAQQRITDYTTGQSVKTLSGPPIGQLAVSGYSSDFRKPFFVTYSSGTDTIRQPSWMQHLPMSLWNVSLEAHTGRLFINQAATYFYIFLLGIALLWILWSGWKLRKRKLRKQS